MYSPSIVSVLVLVFSIGIAIAAIASNSSIAKSSRLLSTRSESSNTTKKVVTFRQCAEIQCTCVIFYLCENDKVVELPTNDDQDRCNDVSEVCCKEDPSPVSLQVDTAPSAPPPLPSADNCGGDCICVPFQNCIEYQLPPVLQANDEKATNNTCQSPDVCCPPCNVSQSTTSVTDLTADSIPAPTPTPIVNVPSQSSADARIPTSTEFSSSSVTPVTPLPTVEQECGIKGKMSREDDIDTVISIGERIQNKDENGATAFGEFPWMVALFKTNTTGELICGASLLTPFIVLTAAHCISKIDMHSLRVRVGEYNIDSNEDETLPHQDRTVKAIHVHPKYNPKKLYNDLALLRVDEPFIYNWHINGICVPMIGTPYAEKNSYNPKRCWVAGWGKGNFSDKSLQRKLKKVEVPIVDHNECQKRLRATRLGNAFVLDSSFACAGGIAGYDACIGDGGGSLFCSSRTNEHKLIQVGVVSWGIGCGTTIPGIYASLETNSEWLTNEINTMSVFETFL